MTDWREKLPRRSDPRGYTLVEVAVALLLSATVAGMAVPSVSDFRAQLVVGAVAREIAVDLHRTRMRAVAENTLCRLVFDEAGTYRRECSRDGTTWVSEAAVVALPPGVRFLAAAGVQTSTVAAPAAATGPGAPTFNRLGTVAADSTITLTNQRGHQKVIHVNVLGRITVS